MNLFQWMSWTSYVICVYLVYTSYMHSACRTLKGPAIPVPDALRVHMAVGVMLDGVHWHCDVGYGGKGLRLPIRNDLIQTSKDGKFASGLLRQLPFPCGLP